jgi:hypothetical protein
MQAPHATAATAAIMCSNSCTEYLHTELIRTRRMETVTGSELDAPVLPLAREAVGTNLRFFP